MKTSEWIILGVITYLWYQSKKVQGPPTVSNDPCNALSTNFDLVACESSGRQMYYPVD